MGCVRTTNFVVLVNGEPSYFSRVSHGTHLGNPLSPFLFLLIIKELSILIMEENLEGKIKGVEFG